MRKLIVLALFSIASTQLKAQNLFQDASGQSNIFIVKDPFGWIRFNSSDQSVSLGYNHLRSAGYDFKLNNANWTFFEGGDLKVNSKSGIANIFKGDQLNAGLAISGNFGINTYNLANKGNYQSIYLRGGLNYDNLSYIYNSNNTAIIAKTNSLTGRLLFNWNYQFNLTRIKTGGVKPDTTETYLFLGFSSGFSRLNNYNDLNDITARTLKFGNTSGTEATTIVTGKNGQYKVYSAVPLNVDVGYTPRIFKTNTIGFNSYFRTNFFKTQNTADAGVGIYISKKDIPSNIIGGLAWQFNDIGNELQKPGSLTERSSVFFYVGYTISGSK